MIQLPEGVTVYIGGKEYTGEIPAAICPPQFLPAKPSKSNDKPA